MKSEELFRLAFDERSRELSGTVVEQKTVFQSQREMLEAQTSQREKLSHLSPTGGHDKPQIHHMRQAFAKLSKELPIEDAISIFMVMLAERDDLDFAAVKLLTDHSVKVTCAMVDNGGLTK